MRKWKYRAGLLLSFLLLSPPSLLAGEIPASAPGEVGLSSQRLRRVSQFAKVYVDEKKLPGIVTLVARRGRTAHFESVGLRDTESRTPMELDTIFRIFSMTKPVTTVAAMILQEEGRLALDDPVSRYIPELRDVQVLSVDGTGPVIREAPKLQPTIGQLMTHTAGFTYGIFGDTELDRMYREMELQTPKQDLPGFVARLSKLPLLFHPGERWHYGVSTDVLGRVIEVVTGQPLDRVLEERIFRPLDMRDTGFFVPREKLARLATCYVAARQEDGTVLLRVFDSGDSSTYASPPSAPWGGHGLVSTARDYLRFLQMLLNGGELEGTRLLGPKTVELMTRDHLGYLGDNPLGRNNPGFGFGLGFAVLKDVAATGLPGSAGEYNWGGYASTFFWVDPEEELIAILMTQLIPDGTYPLRTGFKTAVYQAVVD